MIPTRAGPLPRRLSAITRWPTGLNLTLMFGVPVVLAGAALIILQLGRGATLAVTGAVGLLALVALVGLLHRFPWLVPWGALAIFCSSAELRLRVDPAVGVAKDAYVAILLGLLVADLLRRPRVLERLRPFTGPLTAISVLIGLYLLNPGGRYGGDWFFGTRLLLEVLALLVLGMLCTQPGPTTSHLVRAMTVVLPLEAGFAWWQQSAGLDSLVFQWGYQYGSQIRVTSDGGLRTSGTFEDPFQLAALAVLGIALALFVATWRQAVVLVGSATAVLAATSVRTAAIEVVVLLVLLAIRRGWWRRVATLGVAALLAGLFILATTTVSARPGAAEESLLLNFNGRSLAWAHAVQGIRSFIMGNGVGARGIGSTRATQPVISNPPAFDPTLEPFAAIAGDPAFLDSSYAQVQSDVGIVGTIALVGGAIGMTVALARRRARHGTGAPWAAFAVLVVSMIDWISRSSLASYTTGFLTLYVLGVLIAASGVPSNGARRHD